MFVSMFKRTPLYTLILAIVVITIIAVFKNRYVSVLTIIIGAVLWYDPTVIDGFLRVIKLKE
jgi:hypothetical protein